MSEPDSPERLLFASTAQAFLAKEAPLPRVRELHAAGTSFERDWWRRAAELGWASMLVPEELGGGSVSGDGVGDLALVAEQIGHSVAPGPFHPVNTVLAGLADAENASSHAETIEALVGGELVASWAVYEPRRAWAPLETTVTATPDGDGFRVDGVKDRVEAGADSDLFLVVTRIGEDLQQFLVPADAAGVTVEPQDSVDLVKRYARVTFEGVTAGVAVGTSAQTEALIARQSQVAQVLQCAEVLGILDTVLEFTIQWALDRYSFGRPLASYQALKHQFADMKIWLEACRATTAAAVTAVGSRAADADLLASIAKSYVGEHAAPMLQRCVQLHGGIGVTWEHDLHLFLRRVTLYRAMFGTPEDHNLRVFAHAEKAAS
ncbi:acyl-CoA dehydrogenase family protein [Mycolicibacterium arenosum]|uniref:Acyl-CoA/acyl-ACP dehydrogenase n=1 Tax=Mycolicibacterium arenosum TaxID=2952157 RepID=A0ABT1M4V7_9MYCO|nr:acyl-CoA dehydrogenase family protein [Mycolicibacterium sp. CAU 1645]MCP9272862.1 acyl-CoA/acyl-ACP dehydrogenase [Mycolicibacterium sp. CAU 1645]